VKFTQRGKVLVNAHLLSQTETDAMLRFTVRDTGIGISAKQQQRIFQKFSQADTSTTRQFGGTGLGLAISKELVELMGGEIGINSQLDAGSEFWFTICVGKPPVQGSAVENAAETLDTPLASQATSPRIRPQGAKILVAEDNVVNQEVALWHLQKLGLQADVAADGAEAIKSLQQLPYDLVLMDMQMPVLDGLEATRIIRDPDSGVLNHEIPIIAMTANAVRGDRERCLQAGMNDYIAKPVSRADLVRALDAWLPKES